MLEDLKVSDLLKLAKLLNQEKEIKTYSGYKIVRTYSAGVFAGEIESKNGQEVVMKNARRLWKWSGAACLSQISKHGVNDPDNCKFSCEVKKVELLQVIEILDCTEESKNSIMGVKEWKI